MGVEMEDVDRPVRRGDRLHDRIGHRMIAAEGERDRAQPQRLGDRGDDDRVVAVLLGERQIAAVGQHDLGADLAAPLAGEFCHGGSPAARGSAPGAYRWPGRAEGTSGRRSAARVCAIVGQRLPPPE